MRKYVCILWIGIITSPLMALPINWSRTQQLYLENSETIAGEMEIIFEEIDGRGQVKNKRETLILNTLMPSGEVETETVYTKLNGEWLDPEEDRESSMPDWGGDEEDSGDFARFFGEDSPFDPHLAYPLTTRRLSDTERYEGILCRAYEYRIDYPNTDRDITGTFWLDESTGIPYRMVREMASMPFYLSELQIDIRYQIEGDSFWVPAVYEVNGEGGFLFIRQRIRVLTFLRKYLPRT